MSEALQLIFLWDCLYLEVVQRQLVYEESRKDVLRVN